MNFTIFYSWQSDLPDQTNKNAIRASLREACTNVENEIEHIKCCLDDATRDTSGSPNIPLMILKKIRSSDAFVCDITTINATAPDNLRRTPNPNVIFELGYAVAHLGWERIIMLFNQELGEFPKDTPFDIDRQRISKYRLSPDDFNNKSNRKSLSDLASEAIKAIVINQPQRPFELLQQSPDKAKYSRDLEDIRWAMNTIHIPTIHDMIGYLPYHLPSKSLYFWESFNYVVSNPLFHIYNDDLKDAFCSFKKYFFECVSHGDQYHSGANSNLYFSNPNDEPLTNEQEIEWKKIELSRDCLHKSLNNLLSIIREQYLEINIKETNKNAWNSYINSQN